MELRTIDPQDMAWLREVVRNRWGSTTIVTRGIVYQADSLPGFIVTGSEGRLGVITYAIRGRICEIVTLNALAKRQGIGSALLAGVIAAARNAGCSHIAVVTTNDNIDALAFYQKRGFAITAFHKDVVRNAAWLDGETPILGESGIPVRDEIHLEREVT
jgi:ribosomal protein S18 acetylase RimI-like enzyme